MNKSVSAQLKAIPVLVGGSVLKFSGQLLIDTVEQAQQNMQRTNATTISSMDIAALAQMDTAGTWLLVGVVCGRV
jgi:ABC-type transporter Mla MlaB component